MIEVKKMEKNASLTDYYVAKYATLGGLGRVALKALKTGPKGLGKGIMKQTTKLQRRVAGGVAGGVGAGYAVGKL